MNIKKDILWRVVVSILFLGIFGISIIYSAFRLQYAEGDHWRSYGDSLHVKYRKIPAVRGSIYSDDGSLLATSVPRYKISLDFQVIHKFHKDSFNRYKTVLAKNLARTLQNRDYNEYLTLLSQGYNSRNQYLTLTRNANFIQTRDLLNWPIFHAGRYKGGVILEERTVRKKPYADRLVRTIGFINENHKGAGIEASFDDVLSGVDGEIIVRRISNGYRPLENDMKINAEDGKDIFTTINIHLQDITHQHLAQGIIDNGAAFGTAILLEVKTGAIKALVNLDNTENGLYERFNHAIGTNYEPGSTLKLVAALAALEEGHVSLQDSIDVNYGHYKFFKNDSFEDSGHNDYRFLTYQQVFEVSSNVGISRTAFDHFKKDPEDFVEYYDNLHLGESLHTGIKGEAVPVLYRPGTKNWSGMSVPSMSIGYSLSMSPMHVAMVYNAVANDGKLMKPYLISGTGKFGRKESDVQPVVWEDRICSESTVLSLQKMLKGVVQNGTGKGLLSLPFSVAGKTGTSRISDASQAYKKHQYHSSFVGYFPAENPQYTLLVLISRPTKGRFYGASVALPVFRNIASNVYAQAVQEEIEKTDSIHTPSFISGSKKALVSLESELELEIQSQAHNNQIVAIRNIQGKQQEEVIQIKGNRMPNVIGLGLPHCISLFENNGYTVKHSGIGKVVQQSPLPGTQLTPGRTIYIRMNTKL